MTPRSRRRPPTSSITPIALSPIVAPNQNLRTTVRFSNRPFGVKRFQTIHHHSVDVARGLVLLFGISTTALPSWDFEDEMETI